MSARLIGISARASQMYSLDGVSVAHGRLFAWQAPSGCNSPVGLASRRCMVHKRSWDSRMALTDKSWLLWALLSALFAALTAIFAKVGIDGVDSDFATFIRTVVIVFVLGGILLLTGKFVPLDGIGSRTWLFLVLSGLATGASWLCYFRALKIGDAARVAPIDKLSVVLVAIIAVGFLGEHLSVRGWAGIALIAGGAALVALG